MSNNTKTDIYVPITSNYSGRKILREGLLNIQIMHIFCNENNKVKLSISNKGNYYEMRTKQSIR